MVPSGPPVERRGPIPGGVASQVRASRWRRGRTAPSATPPRRWRAARRTPAGRPPMRRAPDDGRAPSAPSRGVCWRAEAMPAGAERPCRAARGWTGASRGGMPRPHEAAPRRPLDPRRRHGRARRRVRRRGGAGGGLDPSRRDGRPLRPERQLRAGGGGRDPAARLGAARRASDDRAGGPLRRGLREGRRHRDHRSCRGGAAHPPHASGDPGRGLPRRDRAQPRHAGRGRPALARRTGSDLRDDGEPRLRRAVLPRLARSPRSSGSPR